MLVNPDWVDPAHLGARRTIAVAPDEPAAANTFRVGPTLLMAAGFPGTAARLEEAGFPPTLLKLSELQKAEAAGSCMSLIFRRNLAAGGTEA
jgi:dimethylargininase